MSDDNKEDSLSCDSVPLQRPPEPKNLIIFLFPYGSGSAGSYTSLPALDPKVTVIGFVSFFLSRSGEYTLQIEAVARLYASTIQKYYPNIPCILGGWPIGGVYAFEVGKQLSAAGMDIRSLLLLDAPCPVVTPPMSKGQ